MADNKCFDVDGEGPLDPVEDDVNLAVTETCEDIIVPAENTDIVVRRVC